MKKSAVGIIFVFSTMLIVGCTNKEEQAKIDAEEQAYEEEMKLIFGAKTPEEREQEMEEREKESLDRIIGNNKKQAEERSIWEEKATKIRGMEEEYAVITRSTEGLVANVIENINKVGVTVKMPVELIDILGSGDVVILRANFKNGDILMVTKLDQDSETRVGEYKYDGVIYRKPLE